MCDVLPSAVVTCLDPRHVPQSLPEGFEYAVSGISISARGASVFWDLPPSPAWQTACGIALCPSVWVSGVVWPSKNTANTTYVVFFFLILLKKVLIFYSVLLTPSQIILVFMISLRRQGTRSALPGPCFPCVLSSVLVSCFSPAGGQILWFTRVPAASRLCLLQHAASLGTQVQRYCKRL